MAGAKCGLYIHTLKVTPETPAKAALGSNNAGHLIFCISKMTITFKAWMQIYAHSLHNDIMRAIKSAFSTTSK